MANPKKSRNELEQEMLELRERLGVAEELLRAITQGEVDALVVSGPDGEQVFTLQSADYPYRRFVEEMKEGAATVNDDGMILYCNHRLASLLKISLEKIIGSDFTRYIVPCAQLKLQHLFQQAKTVVGKGELGLLATDNTEIPVQVSISNLTMQDVKISCLIITDLTEQKHNEAVLAARTTQLQHELLERQRVEQALRESQSLLKAIFEGTTDLIAALDLDFRYIAFNRAYKAEFLKIFGRDIDIGTSLIEALAHLPQDQAIVVNLWNRALAGEEFTVVQELGDCQRERYYYEITSSSIRNETGQQIGASQIIKNVSDRIQVEQALRQSEERYRSLVTATNQAVWTANAQGYFTNILSDWLTITGQAEADIYNDGWLNQVHPEDKERIRQIWHSALANQTIYEMEYRLLTADGKERNIWARGVPVRLPDGQVREWVGTYTDITDKKQAEQELELQAIMTRNIPGGMCLIRASDWVIVYANPKFERLFGYSAGELTGQSVSVLNYEDERIHSTEIIKKIFNEVDTYGESISELYNVKKDGTPFWSRATISKFNHPNYGTVYVAVQYDVTEQKQAQEQIRASLKEKEVLLKEIHHRVKNNLQIVKSLLQMQSRRTQEKQTALVLQDSQNRIASIALVHEKLYSSEDLANIDFGQYIPDLTTHLFDTYTISSNTVALNIDVDDIFLTIDTAIPCGLIINELVSNALKYAFPNNRKGEIYVGFHINPDNTLTLLVQDNGVGIPKAIDIKRTTSLGLTLVQGLVDQLEGQLECDRTQGTAFRITFAVGKT